MPAVGGVDGGELLAELGFCGGNDRRDGGGQQKGPHDRAGMLRTGPAKGIRCHQSSGGGVNAVGEQQQFAAEPVGGRWDEVGLGLHRPGALTGGIGRDD